MVTLHLVASFATAAPTTTVAWENLPPSAALLDVDALAALSAGSAGGGDGAIVALGYFTGATSAATFTGEWIPLTGPQAANIPFQKTSVGDSSGGGGIADGFFTLTTDFDSANSAVYQRIPAVGTRLSIAIYNRATIAGSTHFNIATHDLWQWMAPDPILPTFVFINPTTSGTAWLGGASTALRTALPVASFPGDAARAPSRLINISTRGYVGTGDAQLIPGFVLEGTGSSQVLVRAVGPTLAGAPYGVSGTLADPVLTVVRRADSAIIGSNDDWSNQADSAAVAAAFVTTGAFPLSQNSADAALVANLAPSPGGYTVNVDGKSGTTGVVIAEAYLTDASITAGTQLVNVSTRGFVGTGDTIMIPGFVLGAGGPRRLLIRAVGPTLGQPPFNLPGTLVDPVIQVVPSSNPTAVLAQNDNWGDSGQAASINAAGAQAGAFALVSGSKDAALVLEIPASNESRGFTVHVSGANAATGLVITEIYELP